MASPKDYTSMPWSMRLPIDTLEAAASPEYVPLDGISHSSLFAVVSSPIAAAQGTNNEALIRQLAEAHAKLRKYEARTANLQIDSAKHGMSLRIKNLEEELGQCRKRENTIVEVFLHNFEKEKELARKIKALEERERKVREEDDRVQAEKQELASARREIEIAKDGLEALAPCSPNGLTSEEYLTCSTPPSPWHRSHQHPTSKEEAPKIRPVIKVLHTPGTETLFDPVNQNKFKEYQLPVTFEDMGTNAVQLLRRHDYYKGWLDATKVSVQQRDVNEGFTPASGVPHLHDSFHAKSPRNAGYSAGMLFTYAALCQEHGKPELGIRLDDRRFNSRSLAVPKRHEKEPFWVGYAGGQQYAHKCFWREVAEVERKDCK
ncbi:hypothetical protein DDE82_007936 [Stemphylium lycopersici]|uniref:Uncharacterized protein n=1 Tax=Stemphylium lycopersici TaxID=183478 RepID=A0A364NBM5_STELY|nr:hypothetical protein TW65_06902 [Stemphylium lycopersici]RAQ99749.1 hypothetical protein DDE82_007936 [Stemphylium lycopersici]RAR14666.1 hypothetical protein DDE83_001889 [Stemphylium lycopersici]